MDERRIDRAIEAWKVTIQVQQHFNDLEMRIRNYALTLLLATSAAAGVALREKESGLAMAIILGGLVVWLMFYLMDEWWYHRLLIGSVKHAMELEKDLQEFVPGIGLSLRIKDESSVSLGSREIRSQGKIRIFYGVIGALMIGAAIAVNSLHGLQ